MELAGNGTAESNESMNNESVNQNSVTDREFAADASAEVAEDGAAAEETVSASADSDAGAGNGSPIDLSSVTGFKAVDASGNEIMVSKDELVNSLAENILMSLNARNGIMTLEEKSTLSAAAASGTDEYENQLPVMNDCSHVRVLDSSGNPGLMTKQRNAEVVGGLFPFTTFLKPYKSYENVDPTGLNGLIGAGIYLFVCHDYIDPLSAYTVKVYASTGTTTKNPEGKTIIDKNMGASLGWYNAISFASLPCNSEVNKLLRRLTSLADIRKHVTYHTARHTCATLLVHDGVAITTVQRLLGHTSVKTTQIYSEVLSSTIVRDLMNVRKKRKKVNKFPDKSLSPSDFIDNQ